MEDMNRNPTFSEMIEKLENREKLFREQEKLNDLEPDRNQNFQFQNYKEAQKRWDNTFNRDR